MKRLYRYTLTLDYEIWPRKLANELIYRVPEMDDHLVSVKDEQNASHIYGDTYLVPEYDDGGRRRRRQQR